MQLQSCDFRKKKFDSNFMFLRSHILINQFSVTIHNIFAFQHKKTRAHTHFEADALVVIIFKIDKIAFVSEFVCEMSSFTN